MNPGFSPQGNDPVLNPLAGWHPPPSRNDSPSVPQTPLGEARFSVGDGAAISLNSERIEQTVLRWQAEIKGLVPVLFGDPLRPLEFASDEGVRIREILGRIAEATPTNFGAEIPQSATFESFRSNIDLFLTAHPLDLRPDERNLYERTKAAAGILHLLTRAFECDRENGERLLREQWEILPDRAKIEKHDTMTVRVLAEDLVARAMLECALVTGDVGGFALFLSARGFADLASEGSAASDIELRYTRLVARALRRFGLETAWVHLPLEATTSSEPRFLEYLERLDLGRSNASAILGERLSACSGIHHSNELLDALQPFGALAVVEIFHKIESKIQSQGKGGEDNYPGLKRKVCQVLSRMGPENVAHLESIGDPRIPEEIAKELLAWTLSDNPKLAADALRAACHLFPTSLAVRARLANLIHQAKSPDGVDRCIKAEVERSAPLLDIEPHQRSA